MMRKVLFTATATRDVETATSWYENQKEGLGDKFLTAVLDTIDRIAQNPEVEKFPYSIWFRVRDDVLVIACLHGKRDRRLAVERASGALPFPEP